MTKTSSSKDNYLQPEVISRSESQTKGCSPNFNRFVQLSFPIKEEIHLASYALVLN